MGRQGQPCLEQQQVSIDEAHTSRRCPGTAMKNDRGVVIRMTSTVEGVQLKLAVEGVTIELEKQPQ